MDVSRVSRRVDRCWFVKLSALLMINLRLRLLWTGSVTLLNEQHLSIVSVEMATAHWLGLRPQYVVPGLTPLYGICAVAVGLGRDGGAWLARLAQSSWFAGLELNAADLRAVGATASGGTWDATATTDAFLPPQAPLITLAVDNPALVDNAAAINLVCKLGALGRVFVTMPREDGAADIARSLQAAGAFIVLGATDIPLDHLHHFPLRAAIRPRYGQLAGVDLADILTTCRHGKSATLLACQNLDAAAAIMARNSNNALIGYWHAKPAEWDLLQFDRCFGTEPRPHIYTTTERLDGVTGTVDLLMPNGTA